MPASWTSPRDWTVGELITESMMDTHIRDNLMYLKAVLDGSVTQLVWFTGAFQVTGATSLFGGLDVGHPTTAGGFIDFHDSGGHADYDVRFVTDEGDSGSAGQGTLVMAGRWTARTGGHIFGGAAGDLLAPAWTEASVLLYQTGANSWAGWGADAGGNAWFRVGTSGTPDPALIVAAATRQLRIGPTGSGATPALVQAGDIDTGLFWPSADQFSIGTGGTERLTFSTNAASFVNLSNGVAMGSTANVVLQLNRLSNDGDIVTFAQASTIEGSISVSGTTIAYNTFTGCHYTQLLPSQPEPPAGAIVIVTGQLVPSEATYWIRRFEMTPAELENARAINRVDTLPEGVTFSAPATGKTNIYYRVDRPPPTMTDDWRAITGPGREGIPRVAGTTTPNDPRAYGVWLGKVAEDTYGRSFGISDQPLYNVACLGLHWCLVTDSGGDLAAGDYITTSATRFCGQKQADDALHSYTVAKAVEAVAFGSVPVHPTLGVKVKRVACTLHGG